MPKLRNAPTDLGKFTQWLARKCRNHHPLQELNLPKRDSQPNVYQSKSKGALRIAGAERNVALYEAGGRTFAIAVTELTDDAQAIADLEAEGVVEVGY